jgi:hypothetical protein
MAGRPNGSAAAADQVPMADVQQGVRVKKLIGIAGNVAAVAGTLLCVLTIAARLLGIYEIAGIDAISLFTVGVGMMVFACLAKLHVLTLRTGSG